MITPTSIQEIQHFPHDVQLRALMAAQRMLKQELGQMQLHKLTYIERGYLDSWAFEHGRLAEALALVEEAIERICPLPELADLY